MQSSMFLGPLGLVLNHNPGVLLGAFADLPVFLRVVCLCTGGAFLTLIYFSLQFLVSGDIPLLRYGMTFMTAGILGNLADRMRQGAVTDFLMLRFGEMSTPVVNLADLVQWAGAILIIAGLIRHRAHANNARRSLWVNPSFQTRYILILLAVALGYSCLSMVFFSTYISGMAQTLVAANATQVERQFLVPFYITFSLMSSGFLILLIVIGRVLSHRMAGPLYAFEEYLNAILKGEPRTFKLRADDEFKHLEDLAKKLDARLKR